MKKISVIVPVYNVENYLAECLTSIINQTYRNLEIILVNDGSTDNCLKICDEYAQRDTRIKVIHQKNGGLSDARNAGLLIATGESIAFVDSDDVIAPNMFEELIQVTKNYDADIAECDFIKFKNIEECYTGLSESKENLVSCFSTEIALENLMIGLLRQVVWNKLYSRKVIDGLEFKKGRINEDEFWTYRVIGNATRVAKIRNQLYFYRQQAGSIMGSGYNIRRMDGLVALEGRMQYMAKNFPALLNLAIKKYCFSALYQYQMIQLNSSVDKEKIYRKEIVKNVKKYLNKDYLAYLNLMERFWLYSFIFIPYATTKLRNFFKIGL